MHSAELLQRLANVVAMLYANGASVATGFDKRGLLSSDRPLCTTSLPAGQCTSTQHTAIAPTMIASINHTQNLSSFADGCGGENGGRSGRCGGGFNGGAAGGGGSDGGVCGGGGEGGCDGGGGGSAHSTLVVFPMAPAMDSLTDRPATCVPDRAPIPTTVMLRNPPVPYSRVTATHLDTLVVCCSKRRPSLPVFVHCISSCRAHSS